MSKLLLTGANGQVGREIAKQASQAGQQTTTFTRSQLDITDPVAIERELAREQPALVINAAAYTAVDRAEQEQDLAFAVNRDGAANLAAACARHGIPLIHISTDYVFDGHKARPYEEDDPASPLGVYGQSKLAGEEAIRGLLDQHLILRTSWVFGSHGANFVKTVLRLAGKGGPLRIVEDQLGAPTSAQSIANCLLQMTKTYAEHGKLPWGSYHFSGTPHTSWYGFAREIVRQARDLELIENEVAVHPITTAEFPTPAERPPNSRLNTTRAQEQLACPAQDWRTDLQTVLTEIKSANDTKL